MPRGKPRNINYTPREITPRQLEVLLWINTHSGWRPKQFTALYKVTLSMFLAHVSILQWRGLVNVIKTTKASHITIRQKGREVLSDKLALAERCPLPVVRDSECESKKSCFQNAAEFNWKEFSCFLCKHYSGNKQKTS
jgi:hypothetical protein